MVHNKNKIEYYFYLNIIKKGRWEEKRGRGTKKGEGGKNIKYYHILKMITMICCHITRKEFFFKEI